MGQVQNTRTQPGPVAPVAIAPVAGINFSITFKLKKTAKGLHGIGILARCKGKYLTTYSLHIF